MLEEALKYPVRGENWLVTIVIGGALIIAYYISVFLYIISPLFLLLPLIIAIPLMGYFLRVLRSAAREEASAPGFENWSDLFVDGFKVFLVSIAYFFPYLVIVAVNTIFGSNGGILSSAAPFLIFFLVLVVFFVSGYVLPVALTNLALKDLLGAAFRVRTVFGAAFTGRYFVAAVLAIVLGFILNIIASFLFFLLVGFFLQFYLSVFIFYLLGTGCGPKLIDESRSGEQSPTDPVEH